MARDITFEGRYAQDFFIPELREQRGQINFVTKNGRDFRTRITCTGRVLALPLTPENDPSTMVEVALVPELGDMDEFPDTYQFIDINDALFDGVINAMVINRVHLLKEKNPPVYVNAYHITREYGGPEEGGWWYNQGEPLQSLQMDTEGTGGARSPEEWKDIFTKKYTHLHDEKHSLGATNSGGKVEVKIEDRPARAWPETRPHYE